MSSIGHEHFHWLDYVIFSLMLLTSCGIGIYHALRTKKQNQDEYLLGSRKMRWFPVALSLVVSFTSGITQLGKPAEVYLYGAQYAVGMIGLVLGMLIAMVTFLPLLYKLQLTSSYEYLELRFQSKAVRRVGSLNVITSQLIYIGLATYSPAIALEAVTDFPVWASILCVGAIATFYTMLGGMKAVVWTDVFQSVIMFAGILSIIIVGIHEVGGVKKVWDINQENGRINFFNFDPNPMVRLSFWSLLFGKICTWLPYYSVIQTSVQRYCCVPTIRKAKQMLLMNIASCLFVDLSMFIIGLIISSYFSQCDPVRHPDPEQRLSSPNQLVPVFVMKVMGWPGVPGVFLSCIFSGSLSAVATVTWEDFLKWKLDYLTEKSKTNLLKGLVLFYGIGGVVFAFMVSLLRGHILQVSASFLDTSSTPLMGLFILGAFFRRTNWLGAIVGCCIGLALPMWMSLGSYLAVSGTPPLNTSIDGCLWNGTSYFNFTTPATSIQQPVEGIKKLYTVSFMWFPVIGTVTTVAVGLLASALTAPFITSVCPEDIKENYLIFPLDCCFGKKSRKKTAEKADTLDQNELKELSALVEPETVFSKSD